MMPLSVENYTLFENDLYVLLDTNREKYLIMKY